MQNEHPEDISYTIGGLINRGEGGLYPGGLISRIIYSLANKWMGLYRGGGGGLGL